ncbi:MAG: hypothetical protein ACU837_06375 [Gammaproteobacteria bacterium]
MAGSIAAIAIVYWFYKSAASAGKDPLMSAILGFIVYFIPAVAWTVFVTPGLRDAVEHNSNTLLALVVQYAYIVVAVACAAWVKSKHFAIEEDSRSS